MTDLRSGRGGGIRVDLSVSKLITGDILVVTHPEEMGTVCAFEKRSHTVSNPISVGRYYSFEKDGNKPIVVRLMETEEKDQYRLVIVETGDLLDAETKSIEEIETMLNDSLHLLERVDTN